MYTHSRKLYMIGLTELEVEGIGQTFRVIQNVRLYNESSNRRRDNMMRLQPVKNNHKL